MCECVCGVGVIVDLGYGNRATAPFSILESQKLKIKTQESAL